MRIILALLLLLIYAVGSIPLHGQGPGRVTGNVRDETGAVVPNTEITFTSGLLSKTVLSDRMGNYEISMAPGVYTLRTHYEYFESEKRAPFEVVADSAILLNLRLRVVSMDGPPAFVHERVIKLPKHSATPVMLRYNYAVTGKGAIEYFGSHPLGWNERKPAVLTFNAIAIYANVITIRNGGLFVRATGDVTVEDGKGLCQGAAEATIDFDSNDPVASLRLQP